MVTRLLSHGSNFCCEVVNLLLDALALLETNALYELDLAAQLLGNSLDVVLDGDLVLLNESLLQEQFSS